MSLLQLIFTARVTLTYVKTNIFYFKHKKLNRTFADLCLYDTYKTHYIMKYFLKHSSLPIISQEDDSKSKLQNVATHPMSSSQAYNFMSDLEGQRNIYCNKVYSKIGFPGCEKWNMKISVRHDAQLSNTIIRITQNKTQNAGLKSILHL